MIAMGWMQFVVPRINRSTTRRGGKRRVGRARGSAVAAMAALVAVGTSGTVAQVDAAEGPVRISLATLAPKGSSWHRTLERMGAEWRSATAGAVQLRIFAGGSLGDESEVIRKMRLGKPNAAAISNDGLAEIERDAFALNMPLVFDSYEEWDYVRRRINPTLEEKLAEKGFVVLAWSDIGWVHFFTQEPLSHPDQLKSRRLAASPTDPEEVRVLKSLGFNPIPIPTVDVVMGLQTGMIDSLYLPIIMAEASQLYRHAKNMTALEWAPLQGVIVMQKRTWDRMESDHRRAMLQISREIGEELRKSNRQHEKRSLEAMVVRGLNVVEIDAATESVWKRLAEENYDQIRGRLVDAEVFDKVMELRDKYRTAHGERTGEH